MQTNNYIHWNICVLFGVNFLSLSTIWVDWFLGLIGFHILYYRIILSNEGCHVLHTKLYPKMTVLTLLAMLPWELFPQSVFIIVNPKSNAKMIFVHSPREYRELLSPKSKEDCTHLISVLKCSASLICFNRWIRLVCFEFILYKLSSYPSRCQIRVYTLILQDEIYQPLLCFCYKTTLKTFDIANFSVAVYAISYFCHWLKG